MCFHVTITRYRESLTLVISVNVLERSIFDRERFNVNIFHLIYDLYRINM